MFPLLNDCVPNSLREMSICHCNRIRSFSFRIQEKFISRMVAIESMQQIFVQIN